MNLGQLRDQVTELVNLVQMLGDSPEDVKVKTFGENGEIRKLMIETPDQTIIREWKNWDR